MHIKDTRRRFFKTLAISTIAPALLDRARASTAANPAENARRFHFVQIDVFTSQRLQGNQLSVFTDARGLSDAEMQDLARETNLDETTFVIPREGSTPVVISKFPRLVTTRGSAYTFLPSITGLRFITNLS